RRRRPRNSRSPVSEISPESISTGSKRRATVHRVILECDRGLRLGIRGRQSSPPSIDRQELLIDDSSRVCLTRTESA
ncbi:MAG: hypothetical protein OEM62_05910, partial [Acidobacteriota bacterium]|nr:hypothetical protein [Acidobacteriota bacterium]